jgi:hypothetical protein
VVVEPDKRTRPLFGVNGLVCSRKEKGERKIPKRAKKRLDRADIVIALGKAWKRRNRR